MASVGFSRYWYRPEELPRKEWDEFLGLARKIVAKAHEKGIALALEYDQAEAAPALGHEVIQFNGVGPEGHESFIVARAWYAAVRPQWEVPEKGLLLAFCKTNRKPYDLAVSACLVAFKLVFEARVKVMGDGDFDAGASLLSEATGFAVEVIEAENGVEVTLPSRFRGGEVAAKGGQG